MIARYRHRYRTQRWNDLLPLLAGLAITLLGCSAPDSDRATASVSLARGEELYRTHCQGCHGGATGGQMMDIPPPHNARGHTWHHPDCALRDTILNGSGEMGQMMREMMGASKDTPRMPAFAGTLSEEDVDAILAYIKTWWTEEQRAHQARVTQAMC